MYPMTDVSSVASGVRHGRRALSRARPFESAARSMLVFAAIGAAALVSGAAATPTALAASAAAVSSLTVNNNAPSAAAGARTVYSINLTLSAGGSLSSASGSTITVALPAGTGFAGYNSSSVVDDTTANQVGNCGGANVTVVKCSLFGGETVRGGDNLTVTLGGVANPAKPGSYRVSVSTSSDKGARLSGAFAVVAATHLVAPNVSSKSPSTAAAARTVYSVGFSVPPNGGLSSTADSKITITFPNGTDFSGYNSSSVADGTRGLPIGNCGGPATETITCSLFGGAVASAKDRLIVTLGGIANPATSGDYALTVSTTSSIVAVRSTNYLATGRGRVATPAVSISPPSAAAGAQTVYSVSFAVSGTGGLSSAADSRISLTFPFGTGFVGYNSSSVVDDTTGVQVGNCGGPAKTLITCNLFGGAVVSGAAGARTATHPAALLSTGDRLTVTLGGISNPAAGRGHVTVATTSDTFPVSSGAYSVLVAGRVSQPKVSLSSPTPGAQVVYGIKFSVSATGGLASTANSAITLTFPTGTGFAGYRGSSVVDTTTGLAVGNCGGPSGEVLVCHLFGGSVVNGATGPKVAHGDSVGVVLSGLANPSSAGRDTLLVSTTSDTRAVGSASYLVRSPV